MTEAAQVASGGEIGQVGGQAGPSPALLCPGGESGQVGGQAGPSPALLCPGGESGRVGGQAGPSPALLCPSSGRRPPAPVAATTCCLGWKWSFGVCLVSSVFIRSLLGLPSSSEPLWTHVPAARSSSTAQQHGPHACPLRAPAGLLSPRLLGFICGYENRAFQKVP